MRHCLLTFFSKSTFSKNPFRNTIRVPNSLDPDQARHYVGPDLGPICFAKVHQQTTLVVGERVELHFGWVLDANYLQI